MEVKAYGNSPTIGNGSALRPSSSKSIKGPVVKDVPGNSTMNSVF